VLFALSAPSIIDALTYSYYLWAPTIVFPLLLAVVWKVHNTTAGLSAIVSGTIVTATWTWGLHDPFSLPGVIPGVIANILAFYIAYILTKNRNQRINYGEAKENGGV
jgi:SSS family solute:Na+ symporter